MNTRHIRRITSSFRLLPALGMFAIIGIALIATLVGSERSASANVNHPSVVPESPRRDVPIVLDGDVWKSVQIHDRVVVAGEFTQVQTVRGGPTVNRSNIFAYDINTGEIIDDFDPVVNGTIFDVVFDESDNSLFLGGQFTQIDGQFRIRLAKLDYFGELDQTFIAEASAQVLTLAVGDGELYLGGSFLTVNGETHDSIAAVNTSNGRTVDDFNYQIVGNRGKQDTRSVRALDLNSANNRLFVAFSGESIIDNNGQTHVRNGIAAIDLSRNIVDGWRTDWFKYAAPRCSGQGALQLRDGELSPDESIFVVVEKGNYECDKVVAFPVTNGMVETAWVTAAHDSVFSVGITNNAVYVGGHFCFVEAHGSIDAEDAATYPWVKKPEPCDIGGGNDDIDNFSARQQIAALDPQTGAVLDWNPTSNALVGVLDIEPIDRGLLIGQDADRINTILTGRHAFIDFGGNTPGFTPPVVEPFACQAVVDGTTATITWDAEPGVDSYIVRRDNGWVATVNSTSYDDQGLAAGDYEYAIRYRVNGQTQTVSCSPTTVTVEAAPAAEPFACRVAVDGTTATISWDQVAGVNSYIVRRDNGWVATVNSTSYDDQGLSAGDYDYAIRYRQGGQTLTVACSPSTVTVVGGGAPANLTCTVNNQGVVSWTAIDGVSNYQVRKNGGWLAASTGTSYTDASFTAGDDYAIRYRQNGQAITVSC